MLKQYDDALESYDRALGANPQLAEAWANKGTTLAALKRREEAIAAYDTALGLDPGHASARKNREELMRTMSENISLSSQ